MSVDDSGNNTSSISFGVIAGISIGSFFLCIFCILITAICCKSYGESYEDSEEIDLGNKISIIYMHDVVYPEGENPNLSSF